MKARQEPSFAERLGERGPLPEVVDTDSEACWQLWDEAVTMARRPLRAQEQPATPAGEPQAGGQAQDDGARIRP